MYDNGTIILIVNRTREVVRIVQNNLIILMKEKHVTNKQLADLLGISEKQMGYKIKGKTSFKSTEMFKISNFFNRTIEEIFLPSMYENGT